MKNKIYHLILIGLMPMISIKSIMQKAPSDWHEFIKKHPPKEISGLLKISAQYWQCEDDFGNNLFISLLKNEYITSKNLSLCLKLGCPFNSENSINKTTALMHLVKIKNIPKKMLARIMKDYSLNPNTKNNKNKTALFFAAKALNTPALELLLGCCDPHLINLSDKKGNTPLHKGINNYKIVELLLRNGALHKPNRCDEYPLDHLDLLANLKTAQLLIITGSPISKQTQQFVGYDDTTYQKSGFINTVKTVIKYDPLINDSKTSPEDIHNFIIQSTHKNTLLQKIVLTGNTRILDILKLQDFGKNSKEQQAMVIKLLHLILKFNKPKVTEKLLLKLPIRYNDVIDYVNIHDHPTKIIEEISTRLNYPALTRSIFEWYLLARLKQNQDFTNGFFLAGTTRYEKNVYCIKEKKDTDYEKIM